MRLNKKKNLKRNIVAGFIERSIEILCPFIMRTLIINRIGIEYLGLDSLFSSILQVLNMSELGLSSAIAFSMYKPVANNDTDAICSLLNFYKKAYKIIGTSILIVGLALLPFIDSFISGDIPNGINIYFLYLFYLTNTVLSYLLFAYKNILFNSHQRTDISSLILTVTKSSMYLFQILIILTVSNYYLYVFMLPLFTLINNFINAAVTKKYYPKYICKGKISKATLDNIKVQVAGLMVSKICEVSRNSFDSIILSSSLGLAVTALYNNYYYIIKAVTSFMGIITNGLLAGVGNNIALDSPDKNYGDMKKINFIYMWLSGWFTICLLCLYQPFMALWVGYDSMFSYSTVILFCLYFYALRMGDVRALYSNAAGLWWQNRYRSIVESISNLILNIILVNVCGVNGVVFATLISLLVINFGFGSQIVFKYYFKNGKTLEYFANHFIYAFVTLISAIVTIAVSSIISFDGLFGFIFKAIECILIPNIIYFTIYFKTNIFKVSYPLIFDMVFGAKK